MSERKAAEFVKRSPALARTKVRRRNVGWAADSRFERQRNNACAPGILNSLTLPPCSNGNRSRTPRLLQLQNYVSQGHAASQAYPNDDRNNRWTAVIKSQKARNHPHLKKYQRDGIAPRHPLPVLLHLSMHDEVKSDRRSADEQGGIDHGCNRQ